MYITEKQEFLIEVIDEGIWIISRDDNERIIHTKLS
jgi:hypothetical protein